MLTHDVATSDELSQAELESYTALFELLSQIDQRLMDEDPEYRKKYYPEKTLGKESYETNSC